MRVLLAAVLAGLAAIPGAGGAGGTVVLGESIRGLTAGSEGATPAEVRRTLGKPVRIVHGGALSESIQIWYFRHYVVELRDPWAGTDGFETSGLVTSNPRDAVADGTRIGTTRRQLTARYRRSLVCLNAVFCRLNKDVAGERSHESWFQLRAGRVIRIGVARAPAGLDVGLER